MDLASDKDKLLASNLLTEEQDAHVDSLSVQPDIRPCCHTYVSVDLSRFSYDLGSCDADIQHSDFRKSVRFCFMVWFLSSTCRAEQSAAKYIRLSDLYDSTFSFLFLPSSPWRRPAFFLGLSSCRSLAA